MRNIRSLASFCFFTMVFSGCSSVYWANRGNDALDVITASAEWNVAGVMAEAGPLIAGLRIGGDFEPSNKLTNGIGIINGKACRYRFIDGVILIFHMRMAGDDSNAMRDRGKEYLTLGIFPFPVLFPFPLPNGGFLAEDFTWKRFGPRYTQIEAAAGLWFGGLRIGINPGEFLDFMLGFTTLDIYNDDIVLEGVKKE